MPVYRNAITSSYAFRQKMLPGSRHSLQLRQQHHTVGSNPQLFAGKAQFFLCGGFHAHILPVNPAHICNSFLHGRDKGCQLWRLCQNGGIQITDPVALVPDQIIYKFQ